MDNTIAVSGTLASHSDPLGVDAFDAFLDSPREGEDTVRAVLIDGPAGIGKTKFIERLAFQRAANYRRTARPLILHVQSRGRVLTYLQDLIAASLQILRLSVTFDQVPILARHGLVTIAIDGFDELGDPNGYDLAWNQVNELVDQIRGEGTLLLAGRDTFIGRDQILSDIIALKNNDQVDSFSLLLPKPHIAKRFLKSKKGWPDNADAQDLLDDLLQPDSYALRPFFLAQLDADAVTTIIDNASSRALAFLVNVMIDREAGKFGDVVDKEMTFGQRKGFVRAVLREVARSMAEDQTETITEKHLAWLVEVAAVDFTNNAEVLRILQNRAMALAFLERDDDPRARRFPSSQISNHFLAEETVERIAAKEIPKYVRRNILGADFLSAFSDLMMHWSGANIRQVRLFFDLANQLVEEHVGSDRTPRNLGSLLLVTLPAVGEEERWVLAGLDVDEALLEEVSPPSLLRNVIINQLDVRGASVANVQFVDCSVHTMIVDDATRLSPSFPKPITVRYQDVAAGLRTFADPEVIREWIERHGGVSSAALVSPGLSEEFHGHEFVKILERACRGKSFWIPIAGDDTVHRFAQHAVWPEVMAFLEEQKMGHEVVRGVGGPRPRFFRIRNSRQILELLWGTHKSRRKVSSFRRALERKIAGM